MVRTAYQEKSSATAIRGTKSREMKVFGPLSQLRAAKLRSAEPRAASYSRNAHCATKASSATVATARPTATLANQSS